MSGLNRRRVLMARIEATYGTDPVPAAATHSLLPMELELTPFEGQKVARNFVYPDTAKASGLEYGTRARVRCAFPLTASNAAGTPPPYATLLRACGLTETISAGVSVTYAPVQGATFDSATLYLHQDGVRHILTGCRGTFTLDAKAGEIPQIKFDIQGLYPSDPTAQTFPSPTFPAASENAVAVDNASLFTFGGLSLVLDSLSVDLANEIVFRDRPNAEDIIIADRASTGSVSFEAPALPTLNLFATTLVNTTHAIVFRPRASGRTVAVNIGAAQIERPAYAAQDGRLFLSSPFKITRTPTLSDEFNMVFN